MAGEYRSERLMTARLVNYKFLSIYGKTMSSFRKCLFRELNNEVLLDPKKKYILFGIFKLIF